MLQSLLVALVLGLRHALDADHLAAIAALLDDGPRPHAHALSTRNARPARSLVRAIGTAARWGAGHALSVSVVGVLVIGFRSNLPSGFDAVTEGAVSAMLLVLGVRTVAAAGAPRPPSRGKWQSFIVGTVHGLGGSAALSLLAASSLPTRREAFAYLLVFGAGTVLGMVGATVLVARSVTWVTSGRRSSMLGVTRFAGVASIAMGSWMAVQLFASR